MTGSSNLVRIIGGVHRGRRLHFSPAQGLRPTADRVRETLFNWLQAIVPNARCLDLFAGSGALGFEAVSRGAASVTMVESQHKVTQLLVKNIRLLDMTDKVELISADSLKWLRREDAVSAFDIVFLDPPFNKGLLEPAIELLETKGWLADRAFIYLEQEVSEEKPLLPRNWRELKCKKAGQVSYRLIERSSSVSQ